MPGFRAAVLTAFSAVVFQSVTSSARTPDMPASPASARPAAMNVRVFILLIPFSHTGDRHLSFGFLFCCFCFHSLLLEIGFQDYKKSEISSRPPGAPFRLRRPVM